MSLPPGAGASPSTVPIVLDAYAARSCPVKTQNAYDPTVPDPGPFSERSGGLFDGGLVDGAAREDAVLDRLAAHPGAVDLRPLEDASWPERVAACTAAMEAGAPIIVRGALPLDVAGHRRGFADAWVRDGSAVDGRAGYLPVEVKRHKIAERARGTELLEATVSAPTQRSVTPGQRFRFSSREGVLIQLAHYYRMLQAAGRAATGTPFGGVIGTDHAPGEELIGWVALDRPAIRTFSRTAPQGFAMRSPLRRYDHEHEFRVTVATTAQRQGEPDPPPLRVQPIVVDECGRCVWFEHCRARLDDDDLSLRIAKGPLDVREITVLRSLGVHSTTDLAGADLDVLLPRYLSEVSHRPASVGTERLVTAQRRARLIVRGVEIDRIDDGPIPVPSAPVEIDFDLEAASSGRVYLWGFWVRDADGERYVDFTAWTELDAAGERDLAHEAVAWLRAQCEAGPTIVYHYSGYERAQLRRLAEAFPDDEMFAWAVADDDKVFCDLYDIVKQHWFGARGLGLKVVAKHGPGFAWRDEDPGGLNSQAWFADAVHAVSPTAREQARERVLQYNEDDVRATAAVRDWLRAAR